MKIPAHWFVAALVSVAGAVSAVPIVTSSASASPTAASWSTLDRTGLAAASAYRGDGPLTAVGNPSPVSDSFVITASGTVSVAQRTVVAVDTSGTVLLNLTLLGSRQLIVTELSSGSSYSGAVLVLEPDSSTVEGVYPRPSTTEAPATTSVHRAAVGRASVATLREPSSSGPRSRGGVDRLVTIGGCFPNPQTPGVIGSTFGPLVMGEGIISCGTPETLSQIVSIYRSGTQVGGSGSGSNSSNYLAVNAYYGCTVIGGTNPFVTAELWSVNGVVQGGRTSGTGNLHCA